MEGGPVQHSKMMPPFCAGLIKAVELLLREPKVL